MKTYKCQIGSFEREIQSNSPEEAAASCVESRVRAFSWFANQSPRAVSVDVDGIEYQPAEYATDDAPYVWGK